jgi:peptide-methionine (R)-S-oxide reductase
MDTKQIPENEGEWKTILPEDAYHVLREKGTEPPGTGKYLHEKKEGTYTCVACGNPLFASDAKFDSGTGWPSFDQALPGGVKYVEDITHGMSRVEVVCAKCNSHLGHVFDDGPETTGKRFCMNSVCLDLQEKKSHE